MNDPIHRILPSHNNKQKRGIFVSVSWTMVPRVLQQARNWYYGQRVEAAHPWRRSGVATSWALVAGVAALFLTERLPMFRRDFFSQLPLLGHRWASYRPVADEDGDSD